MRRVFRIVNQRRKLCLSVRSFKRDWSGLSINLSLENNEIDFDLEICDKLSAEEQNSLTHYLQELSEERIEQNEKLGIQIIPRKIELQRSFVHEMIPFIGLKLLQKFYRLNFESVNY